VAVRRLVVNQVISPDSGQAYWDRLRAGQAKSVHDVERLAGDNGVALTKVGPGGGGGAGRDA
jgi:hypothetical protein